MTPVITRDTDKERRMQKIIGWILSVLLAALFVFAAIGKLTAQAMVVTMFHQFGYTRWFMTFVGILELIAGIAILVPRTAVWGAALMMVIMVGAIVTEVVHGTLGQLAMPVIVLVLATVAGSLRRPVAFRNAVTRQ
jgi:uncharacterized membrane protein YphA (DoxX/SURF4 family)